MYHVLIDRGFLFIKKPGYVNYLLYFTPVAPWLDDSIEHCPKHPLLLLADLHVCMRGPDGWGWEVPNRLLKEGKMFSAGIFWACIVARSVTPSLKKFGWTTFFRSGAKVMQLFS